MATKKIEIDPQTRAIMAAIIMAGWHAYPHGDYVNHAEQARNALLEVDAIVAAMEDEA